MKPYNFYAGPAILPEEVLLQAQDAIKNFAGTGLSILEISHRSKEFVKVMDDARALVKELMQLNDDREVLFMHGGGLSQFHMVPMNLLNENETASYFDTGTWANAALEEAKLFGNVHIACSSADKNYSYIPKEISVVPGSKYLHVTTNNTIYGTQLHLTPNPSAIGEGSSYFPDLKGWLVADMSSDILSREMDYNQFDLIYAAAQKNIGAAGVTLVVVNKNILGKVSRKIPRMMDYALYIKKESMLNTPSVFAVYVSYLTLQWIQEQGIQQLETQNNRKAAALYAAIDASSIFTGTARPDSRSTMNVCFVIQPGIAQAERTRMEENFLRYCEAQGIVGLKGHRTVGGFRASLYNAMPQQGVDRLIEVMREFERTNA